MELENQFLDCGSCKLFSVSVTSCHKTRVPEFASQYLTGAQVQKRIDDLVEAHSALIGLLESSILSPATRRQLELFREELEREIEAVQKSRNAARESSE